MNPILRHRNMYSREGDISAALRCSARWSTTTTSVVSKITHVYGLTVVFVCCRAGAFCADRQGLSLPDGASFFRERTKRRASEESPPYDDNFLRISSRVGFRHVVDDPIRKAYCTTTTVVVII